MMIMMMVTDQGQDHIFPEWDQDQDQYQATRDQNRIFQSRYRSQSDERKASENFYADLWSIFGFSFQCRHLGHDHHS